MTGVDDNMKIIEFRPEYRAALIDISLEWLKKYDVLEDVDVEMVSHPEKILDCGGHIFLAQTDAGEIVGMIMVENQGDCCELLKLGVRESAQGKGAGKKLIDAAVGIARQEGKKKVVLCSNHKLKAALHLYEKAGFRYTAYAQNHFALSDISMELIL